MPFANPDGFSLPVIINIAATHVNQQYQVEQCDRYDNVWFDSLSREIVVNHPINVVGQWRDEDSRW